MVPSVLEAQCILLFLGFWRHLSKLTQAGLQTLQTRVLTSTTLLQTSLSVSQLITQAELVQLGHTQGEMSSPLDRLRMEPVGSNWSNALCTLVAEPSPETRFTQSSLSQDVAPPWVPTQVRLGCFQRCHRPAGSGQWAVPSLRTPPRPAGISGRPLKPAEAKSCPRGQQAQYGGDHPKSPRTRHPSTLLLCQPVNPKGPRATDG